MASYAEIATINSNAGWQAFHDKVMVAAIIKAHAIINSTSPPATRLIWAKETLESPRQAASDIAFYAIAANSGATVSQMLTASDAVIQGNIDEAVDKIYVDPVVP